MLQTQQFLPRRERGSNSHQLSLGDAHASGPANERPNPTFHTTPQASPSIKSARLSTSSRLLTLRTQSSKPLLPPNPSAADSASSSSSSSSDPLLRKLEDAIHRIIVRRFAPDWLPFLPGSSYWVPPPPHGLNHLVHHFAKQNDVSFASSSSSSVVVGGPTVISTAASQRGWPLSPQFLFFVAS
ncbi:hypothetical protein CMV_027282 [Castanea mollissima]|uniref:Uncharacterized protein n=1 Tax=Castanea mollissima TaxID=60419 RepID=A0A8J4V6P1_9ROSI|nr:hypothetical protein CMV_027282 [Castanea mollissima]